MVLGWVRLSRCLGFGACLGVFDGAPGTVTAASVNDGLGV